MGFNKRRMESERAAAAAKEAEARRALGPQILADAEHLIATWNARQEAHMPMLFSPTIGAAIAADFWFLWVRCPACRTTNAIDLRTLDRHRDAGDVAVVHKLASTLETVVNLSEYRDMPWPKLLDFWSLRGRCNRLQSEIAYRTVIDYASTISSALIPGPCTA
jgi:hypothetical protein